MIVEVKPVALNLKRKNLVYFFWRANQNKDGIKSSDESNKDYVKKILDGDKNKHRMFTLVALFLSLSYVIS